MIYGGVGFNPNIVPSTDRLRGEAGDDIIYIGSDGAEAMGGVGNDTIYGGDAYDEIFGEAGNDLLYGGGDNDGINGGGGDDYIDGGTGADNMAGYDGNDTYIVDDAGDVIYETGGFNTALSSVSYTMVFGINVLTLTGSANLVGTGNLLDNTINGNDGQNSLYGLGGNDTLNGGGGDDILVGGLHNDTLVGGDGNDELYAGNAEDPDLGYSTLNPSFPEYYHGPTLDRGANVDIVLGGAGDDFVSVGYGDFADGGAQTNWSSGDILFLSLAASPAG